MSQFDWREYLDLAKLLRRPGSTISGNEACLRSAISRAYYSVFCYLRPLATRERLILTSSGRDHGLLLNHFKNSKDSAHKAIGKRLSRLFSYRKQADYEDFIHSNITKLAIASINMAEQALNIAYSI